MTPPYSKISLYYQLPAHTVQCYTVSEYVNFLTIEHKKSTRRRFFLHRRTFVVIITFRSDVPLPDYNLVVRGSSNDIYLESGSTQIMLLFLQYDSRHITISVEKGIYALEY